MHDPRQAPRRARHGAGQARRDPVRQVHEGGKAVSRWRSCSAPIRSAISSPASKCRSACASTTTSARSWASRCRVVRGELTGPALSRRRGDRASKATRSRATSASKGRSASSTATTPGKAGTAPGGRDRAHLLPQRPDPRRQPAREAAERLLVLEGGHALGAAARRARRRRRAGREKRLGARDRRRAHVQRRRRSSSATPGTRSQAGHILNQCGVGAYMSRYSVVVDEDIDPANLQEVMWAVATRTDPGDRHRHHPARHGLEERPDVRSPTSTPRRSAPRRSSTPAGRTSISRTSRRSRRRARSCRRR